MEALYLFYKRLSEDLLLQSYRFAELCELMMKEFLQADICVSAGRLLLLPSILHTVMILMMCSPILALLPDSIKNPQLKVQTAEIELTEIPKKEAPKSKRPSSSSSSRKF